MSQSNKTLSTLQHRRSSSAKEPAAFPFLTVDTSAAQKHQKDDAPSGLAPLGVPKVPTRALAANPSQAADTFKSVKAAASAGINAPAITPKLLNGHPFDEPWSSELISHPTPSADSAWLSDQFQDPVDTFESAMAHPSDLSNELSPWLNIEHSNSQNSENTPSASSLQSLRRSQDQAVAIPYAKAHASGVSDKLSPWINTENPIPPKALAPHPPPAQEQKKPVKYVLPTRKKKPNYQINFNPSADPTAVSKGKKTGRKASVEGNMNEVLEKLDLLKEGQIEADAAEKHEQGETTKAINKAEEARDKEQKRQDYLEGKAMEIHENLLRCKPFDIGALRREFPEPEVQIVVRRLRVLGLAVGK
ncbi:hypothetical protein MMC28_002478 [Mycoblastus sanguinarius]|nr:hypothetical protein [Mycoblastus sanguinarius]